jgi:phage terminase large subunit-like protein
MTQPFSLNSKQVEANRLLGSAATHILLRGGSRSGKTFVLLRAMTTRALKAPDSRHAAFRHRFNHIKQSVILDTLPKMMKLCYPDVPYRLNQTDWFVALPNGSELWFGGLDEKERVEKVLGKEFSTIFLNECSQIGYDARNKVMTRLAQKTLTATGEPLALKAYYDANPPVKSHWTYRMFEQKLEPKSGEPLSSPGAYTTMQLNPDANRDNLAPEYLAQLEALPEKDRQRFLLGNYLTAVEGALWTMDQIDTSRAQRPTDDNIGTLREAMKRIVIAIDPSGCSGEEDIRSDEIGIVVAGLDYAGNGHLLEDASGRYSPEGWGRAAMTLYDKWGADRIVAERNFGGSLVESTIRTARQNLPVTMVNASRGKHVRAEPVAALYEKGQVAHHGRFPDLEDQLCQFSAAGYQGSKSPDRADALVWGLTDLMLGEAPSEPARMVYIPRLRG